MTDEELIARLRDGYNLQQRDGERAADRIEALTAENAKLHDHIEGVAKNTHKIMVGYEAKLAKAVEALEGLMMHEPDFSDTLWRKARATLAEIKGT
jgi:hypothetical protein